MTTFNQLGLSDEILKVLTELGFEKPSEIQEQAIPHLIQDPQDFIGLAQTGTGKTAAFGLPLLERIDPHSKNTQALVLAPTRELGQQIAEQLATFSKYMDKLNVLAVYGGAAITNQIAALKRPQHIIIATPGRLLDLIKRKAIKLNNIEVVVLDEADEMLNMGFKEDLDLILSHTPKEKYTWLFSATMPTEIKRIVNKYMDNPLEVRVNTKEEVNKNITHVFTTVKQSDKPEALKRFLDVNPDMRGVVFCRTKRDTQNLAEELLKVNYKADALHGDLSQAQRDRVMKRFKAHSLQVLIATDVAARGIDVNDLTHVFHYTLPDDNSYYTHRSGRTARAGKKGTSVAFINGRENGKIKRLEKQLGIKFEKVEIPNVNEIANIRVESWCVKVLDKPAKVNEKLLEKANELFADISKEDLIAKLLTAEIEQLTKGGAKDLNQASDGRRDREDRGDRRRDGRRDRGDRDRGPRGDRRDRDRGDKKFGDREKPARRERSSDREKRGDFGAKKSRSEGDSGNSERFFINLGSKDDISRKDLADFISDVTRVKSGEIKNIDVQNTCSYFEVSERDARKVSGRFKGVILEDGRELRVNRDS